MGFFQLGMWRFESSKVSQPVWILENFLFRHEKGPPIAGFLSGRRLYRDRIRTITLRNWLTFSRQPLKNSRFLETRSRDLRTEPLGGRGASDGGKDS